MDRTNTPPVDPAALANNQTPRIMPSGKWATPDLDIIPQPASAAFIFILPIFAVILLFVSNLWLVHVEPWFGVATAWCERFATTWRKGRDAENAEFGGEEIISIKSADGQASVHISPRSSPRGSLLPMTEKPVHD
ncbi:hypothetical protein KEM55_000357 [Ascosphaera atra]|nr:hypothetical protein KEM55_000357 [Ascosphaera atra]